MLDHSNLPDERVEDFFTDDVLNLISLVYDHQSTLPDKFVRSSEQIKGNRELINRVLAYVMDYDKNIDMVSYLKHNRLDKNLADLLTNDNLVEELFSEILRRADLMNQ